MSSSTVIPKFESNLKSFVSFCHRFEDRATHFAKGADNNTLVVTASPPRLKAIEVSAILQYTLKNISNFIDKFKHKTENGEYFLLFSRTVNKMEERFGDILDETPSFQNMMLRIQNYVTELDPFKILETRLALAEEKQRKAEMIRRKAANEEQIYQNHARFNAYEFSELTTALVKPISFSSISCELADAIIPSEPLEKGMLLLRLPKELQTEFIENLTKAASKRSISEPPYIVQGSAIAKDLLIRTCRCSPKSYAARISIPEDPLLLIETLPAPLQEDRANILKNIPENKLEQYCKAIQHILESNKDIKILIHLSEIYRIKYPEKENIALKELSSVDEPAARIELALNYLSSGMVNKRKEDTSKGIEILEALAHKDPLAAYHLGQHYLHIEKNYKEAERFTELAANQKFIPALIALGHICLWSSRKPEAVSFFQQAVELDQKIEYPEALALLGLHTLYTERDGEARKLLRKSADHGIRGMSWYGDLFKHQLKDRDARRFIEHAALEGGLNAKYQYGFSGLFGDGGTKANTERGMEWMISAAKEGSFDAHAILGDVYSRGMCGIIPDKQKAIEHYTAAGLLCKDDLEALRQKQEKPTSKE